MRRRDFIALLGRATATWPLGARAQQPAMPVVGFLGASSAGPRARVLDAFRQGLGEFGYIEGRNVALEYRWADNSYDQLSALAADLVRRRVTVIAASDAASSLAAKAATTTIPIVFETATDPIAVGLVTSLNRPGGNLTGVLSLSVELGPKRLELLHELIPSAAVVGLLVNPTNRNAEILVRDLQDAARVLGVQVKVLNATTERDLDAVFAGLAHMQAGALVIGPDPFFTIMSEQIATLVQRYAVPAIYQYREFAAAGGLMSYGVSLTDAYRLVGVYTGRILKGEKPSDLPVQQSTKVELIINLKSAKAFGLTFPLTLLGRADEVIE
ncbi:MAG TPA: ABC transporter substrate-binding protein [Xanthobacteraceae bacterium]|jgi:putative ABC transport system substrate-binding protein